MVLIDFRCTLVLACGGVRLAGRDGVLMGGANGNIV